jgi:hypothetical protein
MACRVWYLCWNLTCLEKITLMGNCQRAENLRTQEGGVSGVSSIKALPSLGGRLALMSGQIFLSYRRDDTAGFAGRLYDRLHDRFPQNKIFIDVDSIDPGLDFVEAIEANVGACDVLIAVIGKRWLVAANGEGRRRLDNPEDFVRLEIGTALKRDIRVIPVLVEGVLMPQPGELPDDLKLLTRRNAIEVSHTRFSADSERLASAVERALEKTATERREREQREQAAAEIRERQEKEQLNARRREHEELERLDAERLEKERLEAQQREKDRVEAEQRQKDRLVAERRQREEKEQLEHEPQAQPPSPVAPVAPSTPPAKPEADKASAETPKVVHPLLPKPSGPERVKSPPSSSGGSGGKSPSKQAIAFLAIAAVLVVGGLIYLVVRASQSPPPQPVPVAGVTPGPTVISTPGEEKAPPTPEVVVQPAAQPTAPVSVATPNLETITTPSAVFSLLASSTPQPTPSLTPSEAEWLAGKRYLDMKDFAKALPHLQKAADAGNADAMVGLGVLYENGQGVAQDYAKAREWYQKAADAGNADAMNNLGLLYQKGQGVTQDYAKAREWYQKAADAGDPIAMDNLGVLYRDGPGGAQDSKRPPTPATRPAGRIRTAGVSPKITPRRASGTKRPPMPATQMRSKRSPASTQSSNALGIPAWITGP